MSDSGKPKPTRKDEDLEVMTPEALKDSLAALADNVDDLVDRMTDAMAEGPAQSGTEIGQSSPAASLLDDDEELSSLADGAVDSLTAGPAAMSAESAPGPDRRLEDVVPEGSLSIGTEGGESVTVAVASSTRRRRPIGWATKVAALGMAVGIVGSLLWSTMSTDDPPQPAPTIGEAPVPTAQDSGTNEIVTPVVATVAENDPTAGEPVKPADRPVPEPKATTAKPTAARETRTETATTGAVADAGPSTPEPTKPAGARETSTPPRASVDQAAAPATAAPSIVENGDARGTEEPDDVEIIEPAEPVVASVPPPPPPVGAQQPTATPRVPGGSRPVTATAPTTLPEVAPPTSTAANEPEAPSADSGATVVDTSATVADAGPARAPQPEESAPAGASGPAVVEQPSFVPPKLLQRTEPVYPAKQRKRGVGAVVVLNVLVDERGSVVRVVVEDAPPGSEFEANSIDAALRSTYRPAKKDGQPTSEWVTERFVFEP